MQAMILAAGLGTRLRPYSLLRPKPLFPVLNTPLLSLTVKRLQDAGFRKIVINCHHLGDQIQQQLADTAGIILQPEEKILGTGGGLCRALAHFEDQPILVVNGDIYHSLDYRAIYAQHLATGHQVTMVMHDYPRFNTVTVDQEANITSFTASSEATAHPGRYLAYTGIQVVNPEVLRPLSPATFHCILDHYRAWRRQGGRIRAMTVSNHFWTDMGTVADYLGLHRDLLYGRIPAYPELLDRVSQQLLVSSQAEVATDVRLRDWVCIGAHARIGHGTQLQRVVVWDGATIAPNTTLSDTIVT